MHKAIARAYNLLSIATITYEQAIATQQRFERLAVTIDVKDASLYNRIRALADKSTLAVTATYEAKRAAEEALEQVQKQYGGSQ